MPKLLMIACLLLPLALGAQLQSPSAFLPHEHGQHFTPHHTVVDYFRHVADHSPAAMLSTYGMTNESRPLLLAFVSSPDNLAKLEDIRQNNLRRAGLLDGRPDPALDRAIVWLSFGVHGNEAAATESSMSALYELIRPDHAQAQEWLQRTIVIIDPSLNPDGYDRYVNWYRQAAPLHPTPEGGTYEHREPWPGGRPNHYFFDLNRDWAWQTQAETQQRAAVYRQWMPHLHVDYHEQFPNNPYYFAPAAAPYHEYVTEWQADFQFEIGKNNARYFDREGWLYFTREHFDLLYPSYGDTYPTFNGAIGMTYEQAGHGIAGRAFLLENGDTLTLADRIAHHTATALATVETAAGNADKLVENFQAYFARAANSPIGTYKSFIVRGDSPRGKLKAFCDLLDRNGIQYGQAGKEMALRAFNYQTGREESVTVRNSDLIVSAYQPMSVLAQVLLEPEPKLEDTLTYDITAWSLPYAFGLEAYAAKQRLEPSAAFSFEAPPQSQPEAAPAYAYLAEWSSFQSARFLSALLQQGIQARYATGGFSIEGQAYQPGTLAITWADNRKMEAGRFHETVARLAREHELPVQAVRTGFSDDGFDLGSSSFQFIKPPKVAMLFGEGTSSGNVGELWHFFERQLGYPVYLFPAQQLSSMDWSAYNVLVLPEGRYTLNEETTARLSEWLNRGGRLIAIGSALKTLENKADFSLQRQASYERSYLEEAKSAALEPHAGQARRHISYDIPGAIFQLELDVTHPLAFGLGKHYHSLKTGSTFYQLLPSGGNVGYIGQAPQVVGFAGYKARENAKSSVVFALERKGQGAAIYLADNPLFRGFWENGKFLFSNALFLAGQ
jgi:hypothetical protein